MRLALVQMAPAIGQLEHNINRMRNMAERAIQNGAQGVVFPELSLVGYPPMDLLKEPGLQEACRQALTQLAQWAEVPLLVGAPSMEGHTLYNAVYCCHQGSFREVARKVLLPNYDVFDESRYFTPGEHCSTLEIAGQTFVLTVCEDIWAQDAVYPYPRDPVAELCMENTESPRVLLNIAASPYSIQGVVKRREVLTSVAIRYGLPVLYVNQVGAKADLIFDGGTSFLNSSGQTLDQCPSFEESLLLVDIEGQSVVTAGCLPEISSTEGWLKPQSILQQSRKDPEQVSVLGYRFDPAEVTKALVMGIRDYMATTGGERVVIGLSGGLDSAMVTCLAAMALHPDNVTALLMPSEYSSERSVRDSVALCQLHGIAYRIIPISPAFAAIKESLLAQWSEPLGPLTDENIQPRLRALMLMAHSNQFGDLWLNSSNKSEAAVGYSTLYGDMGGGLSVIGDLYKTQLYVLARYWNACEPWIPKEILEAPPSAELRPGQLDSDSLPAYPVLDALLMDLIEGGMDYAGLCAAGHEPSIVARVWGLVKRSEFKRYQMPPVLRVSSRSFGRGWRQSLV